MKDRLLINKALLPYSFNILLADNLYDVEIKHNKIADLFTLTLFKNNELICSAEPLIYGQPLFADIHTPDFPAIILIPVDEAGNNNTVTFNNLNETVFLCIYDDNDDTIKYSSSNNFNDIVLDYENAVYEAVSTEQRKEMEELIISKGGKVDKKTDIPTFEELKTSISSINVQADWAEADENAIGYIKHKPEALPANGGNSDTVGHKTSDDIINIANKYTDNKNIDLSNELNSNIVAISNGLQNEMTRAVEAETNLNNILKNEILRAVEAENALNNDLSKEIERAKIYETNLNTALNSEILRATKAEDDLNDNLLKEKERAEAIEAMLQTNLNSELEIVKQSDINLDIKIKKEISRAKNAENDLDIALSSEIARAISTDNSLNKKINDGLLERYTKSETDNRIEAIVGAAPDALDTLQEIAKSLNNDPDFAGTMVSELSKKANNDVLQTHTSNKSNPHGVTKVQVGLSNVDNTSDINKPISAAVQNALNNKANKTHIHTKSEISDFPTSLPANGGNADTVDGKHANEFATSVQGTKADNALPKASYTASDILTKLKTVDGANSELDADLLDGKQLSEVQNYKNLTNKPDFQDILNNSPMTETTRVEFTGTVHVASSFASITTTYQVSSNISEGQTVYYSYNGTKSCSINSVNSNGFMTYTNQDFIELSASGQSVNFWADISTSVIPKVADFMMKSDFKSSEFATAAQGTKADNALPKASYTASDILTKLKTVDGYSSGLDADLLDGRHASSFILKTCTKINSRLEIKDSGLYFMSKAESTDLPISGHDFIMLSMQNNIDINIIAISTSDTNYMYTCSGHSNDSGKTFIYGNWKKSNDNADAQKLNGIVPIKSGGTGADNVIDVLKNLKLKNDSILKEPCSAVLNVGAFRFSASTSMTILEFARAMPLDTSVIFRTAKLESPCISDAPTDYGEVLFIKGSTLNYMYALYFDCANNRDIYYWAASSNGIEKNWVKINDGGNADMIDGKHANEFATSQQGTKADNALPMSSYTSSDILAKLKTVDGTGSGLDADLLDGKHASNFLTINSGIVSVSKIIIGQTFIDVNGDAATIDNSNMRIGTWYGFGITPTYTDSATIPKDKNAFWVNARKGNTYTYNQFYANQGKDIVLNAGNKKDQGVPYYSATEPSSIPTGHTVMIPE